MQILDNINNTIKDDLQKEVKKGSKISIAAACFSIYAYQELKKQLEGMQLRLIEESKIHCAREHFKAISDNNVVYDVVDSYQTLLEKVMR